MEHEDQAPALPRSAVDPEIVIGDGSVPPPEPPADPDAKAGRYQPAAAPATPRRVEVTVARVEDALDGNLRAANQRLRSHLRQAEAMLALRDGVSVERLVVPWPKQTQTGRAPSTRP